MGLLKNHGRTIVQGATQHSDLEKIKKDHGYWPFEGDGFKLNEHGDRHSITWTEIRPIFRLNRKGELRLLGGIKYYVDKFAEDPEEGVWHPAHYHLRGLMTASGYRKALNEYTSERAKDESTKRSDRLDRASSKEREKRNNVIQRAIKKGKRKGKTELEVRREVNVQDIRNEEGKIRGRELYKILKDKYIQQ